MLFNKIEDTVILISRAFLLIFSVIVLIITLSGLIYSLYLTLGEISDTQFKPRSNIETFDNLYFSNESQEIPTNTLNNESITSSGNKPDEMKLSYLKQVLNNMRAVFTDNEQLSRFVTVNTVGDLEIFINETYSEIQDDYLYTYIVPNSQLLSSLSTLTSDLKNSYIIQRVSSYEDKKQILNDLMYFLINEIAYQYEQNQIYNQTIDAENSARYDLGMGIMQNLWIGFLFFLVIILYLMIFKIEISIRKIPIILDENDKK
jgi:hypothetical protein